jgi:hypothetical protein
VVCRAGSLTHGGHLREAIEISVRIDNGLRLTDCFNSCGHLCAATQRWADAVTMWAAYAASLKRFGLADLPGRRNAAGNRCGRPSRSWGRTAPGQPNSAAPA